IESQSGRSGVPLRPRRRRDQRSAGLQLLRYLRPGRPAGLRRFPGATIYNSTPLIVKNPNLTALPPRVVYLHDTSSVVPILFLNANPPLWNAGDILGYFVLAGHGIGFTNSQSDVTEFNNFMSSQPVTCVTTSGTSGIAVTGADAFVPAGPSGDAVTTINPCAATPTTAGTAIRK